MTVVDEIRRDPEQGARRLDSEYRAGLTTLARRICADPGDADELVNRTFAEVVANIDRYAEQSAFFGWMSKILVNLNANDHRRQSFKNEVLPGDLQDCPDEDAQEAIFRNLDHSLLRDAVGQLSPEMRDVVVMRYFMDLPLSRIAKLLSVPEGTVNSRLHYARLALAAKLGAAAKKPGGKAVLLALALCGLTALGAAVVNLANNGESRKSAESPAIPESATADQPDPSDPSDSSDQPDPSGPSGITGWTGMTGWTGTNLSTFNRTNQEQNMNATAKTAAILATAFAMQAASPLAATGATLTLTTSDASGKSSFDKWNISGGGTNAPSADNDYVVDGNRHIRVIWNRTFGGNKITFGASGSEGRLVIQRGKNGDGTYSEGHDIGFGNQGAYLVNGYFTPWESNKKPRFHTSANGSTCGPLTILAPESKPFRISAAEVTSSTFNTNNTITISVPIKGDGGTALMLCAGGNASMPAAADTFTITGDLSDFHGKLIISGGTEKSQLDAVPVDAVLQGTMPGSVLVQSGARVRARYRTTTFTTARLQLQAGATILVNNETSSSNCGKIAVTEELSAAPGTVVQLMTHPYVGNTYGAGNAAFDFIILTLPAEKGTIPLENFVCPDVDGIPPCSLVTNLVDGIWQLTIHKEPHDVLCANDGTSTTITDALPSALTNATSWLSGEAPQAGRMYIAAAGTGGLANNEWPMIRTPYQSGPFVFAGDLLSLGQGGKIFPCCKDVTFPMLNMSANTTYILALPAVPTHLRGKIHLRATSDQYPQRFQAYGKGLNTVEAEIDGAGTIHVTSRQSSSTPYGDIEFTAPNTNFTGRIKVYAESTSDEAKTPATASYCHERVFVTDARNLGGPLDAFRADALELADYSVLEARNDVDMNVANRGVKVTGNAGFAAPEDVTLAISNDITWNGTARKTGAGTLALGGAPRIASGANAALEVQEGFLSVCSTGAVNGVSVSFTDGAYLLVDPAPADDDLVQFGAVDLSPDPFGGELPVAFALPALEGESDSYRYANVAVATVKDAATASKLNLSARKIKGHGVTFTTRENTDGTVTILASISQNAFVMVVR